MAGKENVDTPLLSKCLEFCQALANQGQVFNFSVAIGPTFTFSLDTRSKAMVNQVVKKKKPSPSTLRRNAKRREQFLAKKQQKSVPLTSSDPTAVEPKCDLCDYVAASEKGLRQHIRMKHKDLQPEKMRKSSTGSPLAISPIKDQGREEPIDQDGDEPLDVHFCSCANVQCCRCYRDESCDGMHAMSKACHFCLFCQCKGIYVNGQHVHCKLPKPQL